MDFSLSPESAELKEMARDFCAKRIASRAMEMDEHETTPKDLIDECIELGYFGFTIPEEYGGLGLGFTSWAGVLEEFCAVSAGFGLILSVHNSLCSEMIRTFGSDQLKKKYLPDMASGKRIGAYCITEPQAGTDIASLSATAVDKGDYFLLNGTKTFVTNAGIAGLLIVFAKTDPSAGRKGISCFVVDSESSGITLGAPERKVGIRASDTREVSFADVKVPKENLCGKAGEGFKQAVVILNGGRIGVSFQAIGIARSAFEEALKYSKIRKQFDATLSSFQAIQFKLAEMALRIDAGRLLAYRAVTLKDAGLPCHREASMAKLYCSQAANYVCNEAVQIHGGYGYIKEYPVERYFRDARVTEIYEGTSEAQRMVISQDLLRE
jgi:alkylation response protein AidB-like acyl-CoA dehydrogenase